ncbi:unnamed protein product [Callosobruchus maculatus]|uniref:Uncharacterized protein n=1 Tax=Callosobruchus maculatus TaxID=64391 RepID=A0A653D263_CALMS|nr:unnamed protein product [Callosobruchus maculatus]
MGLPPRVGFSTPNADAQSTATSQHGKGIVHSSSCALGESLLEIRSEIQTNSPSFLHSQPSDELSGSKHGSSTEQCKFTCFGGLEGSRWLDEMPGWLIEEKNLLQSAWRKSTMKTYISPWKRWVEWARQKSVGINNPMPQQLAQYLSHLHTVVKLCHSTICVHKSPSRGSELSSHPVVQQMLKAISLQQPDRERFGT